MRMSPERMTDRSILSVNGIRKKGGSAEEKGKKARQRGDMAFGRKKESTTQRRREYNILHAEELQDFGRKETDSSNPQKKRGRDS